jgi:DNA-binding NarL/FixJ family response regulator
MRTIRTFEDTDVPDVVLHDIGFPGINGITCVDVIKKNFEDIQIIMLTSYDDGENIFDALCAGATGYLLKTSSEAQIINGIRDVMAGGSPMNSSIARKVVDVFSRPKKVSQEYNLTDRERNILHFIIRGRSNHMIAAELMLSAHTIDSHLRKIYEKLHVHSRTEAAAKAVKERII